MQLIQQITSDPNQSRSLVLPDGSSFLMNIIFVPMQLGWFITQIKYNNTTINGLRIVNSPNMLYQFKNQLPFGIACFSKANREPSLQLDFSSGNSKLYLLSQAEVAEYTALLQA